MASYSALVTPQAPPVQGKRDIAHPFKYSREEMLQVYKDAGGFSELPIEVERWEGIVREPAGDPVCLSDFSETEKKLYASSLNSEIRRRQSTDYMAQNDRPKGGPLNSGLGLMGRRRRGDSTGTDHPPLSLPRKTSWSGTPGSLASPSTASPRNRMGSGGAFDGILNGIDTAWGSGKRRIQSGQPFTDRVDEEEELQKDPGSSEAKEGAYASGQNALDSRSAQPREHGPPSSEINISQSAGNNLHDTTDGATGQSTDLTNRTGGNTSDSIDLTKVQWSYVDPTGNVQGNRNCRSRRRGRRRGGRNGFGRLLAHPLVLTVQTVKCNHLEGRLLPPGQNASK
ncbi:uncharacterized protein FOMMEDRAFT_154980 [Fomitiporia mediterranea MF3/22]|uniref:uncharacterized protein n=1 Tax=Fomitiporia mediterranea (strain MF3/22) TaxID=694068 RepID=UPI0004408734|nr:uncharacterized protein FOMMEDRAFT_154980 [Fomitiporia mediterranea MF3/22]EJD03863.1 hypothetical protein FOMMEDRAFT_154980 [Fomitiporia mediterranea MF3/22]